ncbi:MAG: hypothetical protein SFY81_06545 [Verrucomicrobiota bacterium]|nr:hypothetical protein [Verrucomicrobiota bacterium]
MKKKLTMLLGVSIAILSMRADPLNEDEAYDPTDWFDGNNYEYDDSLNLDVFGPDDGYYNYGLGDANRWYDNEWNDPESDFDTNDPTYMSDPTVRDYGWHYQWNPASNRWESDYGWHSSRYDYIPEQDDTRKNGQRSSSATVNATGQNSGKKTVRGVVKEVQTLTLRDRAGADRRHSVAKVTLRDGKSLLVDFGEKQKNLRFQVDPGEEIQISGNVGRISGRRVLFANSAKIGDQNFTIQRQNRNQSGNQNQSRIANISGTVQDIAPIYLNNEAGQSKRLVKLSLQNGNVHIVDLGSAKPADIGLAEGERITLRGQRDKISGRDIIRANRVTVDGKAKDLSANP